MASKTVLSNKKKKAKEPTRSSARVRNSSQEKSTVKEVSGQNNTIPQMFSAIGESAMENPANLAFHGDSLDQEISESQREENSEQNMDNKSQTSDFSSNEDQEIDQDQQMEQQDFESLIQGFNDLRKSLNTKLDSIVGSFQQIVDRKVEPILKTLHDEGTGLIPQIQHIQTTNTEQSASIASLKSENQELKNKLELMTGHIQQQDAQIVSLTNKMTSVITRGMENNFTISGLLEDKAQSDLELVHEFISNVMKIPINKDDLYEVFRLGQQNADDTRARTVLVKTSPYVRKQVLENSSSLRDRTNANGNLYFVNPHQPDAVIEKKKEIRAFSKDLKEKEKGPSEDKKSKFQVKFNSIYIGKKVVRKPIRYPTPKELFPGPTEQALMDVIQYQQSGTHRENSSTFVAYAAHVHSMTEARRFYCKIKQLHPAADHVIAAYKLATVEGYNDDFEYGAGVRILSLFGVQKIQDIATIVVRYHGGKNLGVKRFQCITEAANTAIVNVKQQDLDAS